MKIGLITKSNLKEINRIPFKAILSPFKKLSTPQWYIHIPEVEILPKNSLKSIQIDLIANRIDFEIIHSDKILFKLPYTELNHKRNYLNTL